MYNNNNSKERNRYNFHGYVKEKFTNTGRGFMQQIKDNLKDNRRRCKTKDRRKHDLSLIFIDNKQ